MKTDTSTGSRYNLKKILARLVSLETTVQTIRLSLDAYCTATSLDPRQVYIARINDLSGELRLWKSLAEERLATIHELQKQLRLRK